jgi:Short-chain dehydrogenases of various substrate specificities
MTTTSMTTAAGGATGQAGAVPPLERPFAVVTGGSSGIGKELAKQFATNGYDVLIVAESATGLEEAAREIAAAEGAAAATVDTLAVDLATYEGVEAVYDRVAGDGRPLDAVAINAGVGVGGDFVRETRLEDELNLIQLNVTSAVHLAKRVLPGMVARGHGRILFTASVASVMPAPFEAVYGASKAFLLSFSEALRNELKNSGIVVTALMPGPTDTNFFHRAGMDDTKVAHDKKDDPAEVARQGFEALMEDKHRIIAGSLKTKVMGHAGDLLPDPVTAEQHRKLTEPGSGEPEAR